MSGHPPKESIDRDDGQNNDKALEDRGRRHEPKADRDDGLIPFYGEDDFDPSLSPRYQRTLKEINDRYAREKGHKPMPLFDPITDRVIDESES